MALAEGTLPEEAIEGSPLEYNGRRQPSIPVHSGQKASSSKLDNLSTTIRPAICTALAAVRSIEVNGAHST
jgi:hypothetical protein